MKKYPIRSTTEVDGWLKTKCERCDCDLWVLPSQFKFTRFCSKLCRNETPEIRFWKNTNKDGPLPEGKPELGKCWVWTGKLVGDGYGQFKVNGNMVRAHRFSYELHVGKIPEGMVVLHKCNVPGCVNHEHLACGTQQENIQQCYADGRAANRKGENGALAKFNADQIRQIRKDGKTMKLVEVAAKYGIAMSTAFNIVNGITYKNVDDDPVSE